MSCDHQNVSEQKAQVEPVLPVLSEDDAVRISALYSDIARFERALRELDGRIMLILSYRGNDEIKGLPMISGSAFRALLSNEIAVRRAEIAQISDKFRKGEN